MRFCSLLAASVIMTACRPSISPQPPGPSPGRSSNAARDVHSYAEPDKVVVTHLALDLRVDFAARTLSGTATLDLEWRDTSARELVLDTRALRIDSVEGFDGGGGGDWLAAPFDLAAVDPIFGSKLTIRLPRAVAKVRIAYSTSPEASGLQWLPPELTVGKKSPLMFSQSQAIHARSWVPLQDTPAVRFSYAAQVTTSGDVVALMSANNDPEVVRDGSYRFDMPQPIPSYLLAIAVGDLVFRPVSKRAGVWAEPAVVDRAAREFEDTEKMIVTAESLYGPYRWGRYDILVLPPSFPFGGMENPRLTFATPTVIVGDKSLVSLIAHELAHSWSGNLVTNSTWSDIWLNEGFTTYVENRIVEQLYGRELAEMETVIGQHGLRDELANEVDPADQLLALPPLVGRDPDDALTGVPYVKGQWFLFFLEQRFGRDVFDPFLRQWFDAHAFASVDTAEFERFLMAELISKVPGRVSTEELRVWLHEPGLPRFAVAATSQRFTAIDAAASDWSAGRRAATALGGSAWRTQEWVRFLLQLPPTLAVAKLGELDAAAKLTATANPEIAERWYPLTIRSGYTAAQPAIKDFLIAIGRRKLIKPIYDALAKTPDGLRFARDVFAVARSGYHPITVATIESMLAAAGGTP